jgi:hypothetical protein
MYIDILPNDNLTEPAMATFKEVGLGADIAAVRLHLPDGVAWCAVTGWNDGPVPARWTPIEESGDGPARLLSGGEQGLRLARIADPSAARQVRWDVADASQWAEPFLLCTPDTEVRGG